VVSATEQEEFSCFLSRNTEYKLLLRQVITLKVLSHLLCCPARAGHYYCHSKKQENASKTFVFGVCAPNTLTLVGYRHSTALLKKVLENILLPGFSCSALNLASTEV